MAHPDVWNLDLIGAFDGEGGESVSRRLRLALQRLRVARIEVAVAEQVRWREGRSVQAHQHDDLFHMELFEGAGSVVLDGCARPLRGVTLLLIPPRRVHAFSASPGVALRNGTIKFRVLQRSFPGDLPFLYFPRPDSSLLRRVSEGLAWAFEEWQMQQEGWEEVCGGVVKNLFMLLLRAALRQQYPPPPGVLEEACYLMAMQYSQPLTIRGVAARCGIRPDALSRLFHRRLRIPPREYLRNIRLKQAQSLLAGGHTVTEAAEQTGFASVHYFSRVFTRVFGVPPSRCRPGGKTV